MFVFSIIRETTTDKIPSFLCNPDSVGAKKKLNGTNKNVPVTKTPVKKSTTRQMRKSQSEMTLQEKTPSKGEKSKLKKHGSNPRLSGEKGSVTHFCTPKSVTKVNGVNSARKQMKRYFSDNTLSQTPDYYNQVNMDTPKKKMDQGNDEQTVCEGENSNLTVGIRVRPLSFK